MFKRSIAALLAVFAVAGSLLTGCSDEQAVYVESVAVITGTGYTGLNNRYSGMIVSGSTQKIEKDNDKKILEVNVEVGDNVNAGDVLFSYDVKAVELALKKLELECEQLESSIDLLEDNIKSCEKLVKNASGSQKLEYEVQLQGYQIELQENSMELASKEAEIDRTGEMLENADVITRVSGVVQAINDDAGEMDENGEMIPYITIIETGAYRVKGSVSELDINSLFEGAPVTIRSRVDDSTWTGTVEYIEWDNPDSQQNEMYAPDMGESASRYPFYVALDSTDGLLLGQHVYVEMQSGESLSLMLPEYYILDADSDPWVWAAGRGDRIEKRSVELGEYNDMLCCYEILSGLTPEDHIAFPDETVAAGAPITFEMLQDEESEEMNGDLAGEGEWSEESDDSLVFEEELGDYEEVFTDDSVEIIIDDGEVALG